MTSDINLSVGKTYDTEQRLMRIKRLRLAAIFSLWAVVIISIIIFIITIALPISLVKKSQKDTVSNIAGLHGKLVSYFLISDRVKNIHALISTRSSYGQVMDMVLGKVPQDLSIDSMDIGSSTVSVSLSGASLIPINQFIDDMLSLSGTSKNIKNLVVESLVLNPQAQKYVLTLKADVF